MSADCLKIAMFCIHSSPVGRLGTGNTGGMSVYVREVAAALGRRGHRVDLFSASGAPEQDPVIQLGPGVRLFRLGGDEFIDSIGNRSESNESVLRWAFERHSAFAGCCYDILHSHYWLSGCFATALQRRFGIPHLMTFHTLGIKKPRYGDGNGTDADRRNRAERYLAESCTRIVATTAGEKHDLVRRFRIRPEKIAVIPCGVDLTRFRPADRAVCRRRLGLPPGARILLFVGRFAPEKRIDRLLEAVACLKREDVLLLIVGGDGSDTIEGSPLRDRIDDPDLLGRVVFVGAVDHEILPGYYNAADLLVVSSDYESFGLVALEALACGTPVVATKVGAMKEIIKEGRTGVLVKDGSVSSLVQALDTVLTRCSDDLADPFEIRRSVAWFDWPHVACRLINTYQQVCCKGISPEDLIRLEDEQLWSKHTF